MTPKREIIYGLLLGAVSPVLAWGISDPPTSTDKARGLAAIAGGLAGTVMLLHGVYRLP